MSFAPAIWSAKMTASYTVVDILLNEVFFVSSVDFRQILNAD